MYAAEIFKNNSKLGNSVMIWYFEEPSRILTDDVGAMAGEQGVSGYHSLVHVGLTDLETPHLRQAKISSTALRASIGLNAGAGVVRAHLAQLSWRERSGIMQGFARAENQVR